MALSPEGRVAVAAARSAVSDGREVGPNTVTVLLAELDEAEERPPMPDVSDAPQFGRRPIPAEAWACPEQPRLRGAAAAAFGSFKFRGYEGRVHRSLTVSLTDARGQVQTFELPLSVEYHDGELRLVPDLAALDGELLAAMDAGTFGRS